MRSCSPRRPAPGGALRLGTKRPGTWQPSALAPLRSQRPGTLAPIAPWHPCAPSALAADRPGTLAPRAPWQPSALASCILAPCALASECLDALTPRAPWQTPKPASSGCMRPAHSPRAQRQLWPPAQREEPSGGPCHAGLWRAKPPGSRPAATAQGWAQDRWRQGTVEPVGSLQAAGRWWRCAIPRAGLAVPRHRGATGSGRWQRRRQARRGLTAGEEGPRGAGRRTSSAGSCASGRRRHGSRSVGAMEQEPKKKKRKMEDGS